MVHSSIGAASGKREAYVAAKKARKAQLKLESPDQEAYDEAKADLKTLREILDDLDGADGPPADEEALGASDYSSERAAEALEALRAAAAASTAASPISDSTGSIELFTAAAQRCMEIADAASKAAGSEAELKDVSRLRKRASELYDAVRAATPPSAPRHAEALDFLENELYERHRLLLLCEAPIEKREGLAQQQREAWSKLEQLCAQAGLSCLPRRESGLLVPAGALKTGKGGGSASSCPDNGEGGACISSGIPPLQPTSAGHAAAKAAASAAAPARARSSVSGEGGAATAAEHTACHCCGASEDTACWSGPLRAKT